MSLALTALRLQAIAALLADPAIAKLCGPRIYDSRIADFDHREPVPTIVLTTEEMAGDAYSANNGGPPFDLKAELVLEIAQTATGDVMMGGEVVTATGPVATDRELEAALDFLADRVPRVLGAGDTPEAILLREAVTRRITKVKSSRFTTDETGEKFAIRLLTLTVQLKGWDESDELVNPPTGEFASLPEPLRSVCAVATGSARDTCLMLAGIADPPGPDPAPLFEGVGMIVAPQPLSPAIVPDQAADVAADRVFALHADP
ncbi:hypothetical protein [Methylobacterium frigidaeris]|uniref:Uncharacterized protein n=1 Tax=Methylobacterium frigidaeris TaxID=2038277 RepID=A0AA37M7U6_9HYPH|nr:hypothetical protein [Methylobacterium frigidaeris]PIK74821.1 hypothetical protein CS379_00545 [Methylobacterium frigidaeris]GJD65171.1 hypothetical protein MPEAHAMD_5358 [Methylobacterium frigidaeris]